MPLRAQRSPDPAPASVPPRDLVVHAPAAAPHPACRLAARLAASHYEVTLGEVLDRRRRRGTRRATRARHVAMYLAHVAYSLDLASVGAGFGRDRTTVAYACRAIEDARDDPAFDAALAGLEVSAGILRELGLNGRTR